MHAAHTSHYVSPTDIEKFRDWDQDEYSLLELGHQDDAMWEMSHFCFTAALFQSLF